MPSDYIKDIRKLIGHRELLSVGLGAFILDDEGEILFEKRADNGLYCLPGGSIDLKETLEEGLRREVKEEVGLELGELTLFYIMSGEKGKIVYPNGDVTYYVSFFYFAKAKPGSTPKISDGESEKLVWFALNEIPSEEKLLPGTGRALAAFRQYKGVPIVD